MKNSGIISENIIAKYTADKSVAQRSSALLKHQQENWPLCKENFSKLDEIVTKEFNFDNFIIRAQFNPGRIVSSSAKVDKESIKNRKCFLCKENLFAEQLALPYYKNFDILVNPFPIFPEHFTIPCKNHTPQKIKNSFDDMLMLVRDLGEKYLVFYNGPKCGASAPDHLHFQAGNINHIPLDSEIDFIMNDGNLLAKNQKIKIFAINNYLRNGIILESHDKEQIIKSFNMIYNHLENLFDTDEEPMLNIIGYFNDGWKIVIFPRVKHRPNQYFETGEKQFLFSPASVDFGGLMILPRREDFDKLTKNLIEDLFRQVTLPLEHFEYLKYKILESF